MPHIPDAIDISRLVLGGCGVLLLLFGGILAILRKRRSAEGERHKLLGIAAGFLVSVSTIVLLCIVGEVWFFLRPQSNSDATTIGHRRWEKKHQELTNSRNLRDKEFVYSGKPIVAVVGDSFAAGAGVNVEERFSARLQKLLPSKDVWTIARPGWDTRLELQELEKTDLEHVELVILQYFLNDIEGAAIRAGRPRPKIDFRTPDIAKQSYLADQLWAIRQRWEADRETYKTYLTESYADPTIWDEHRAELTRFCESCRQRKIRLVVLIFPFLAWPDDSKPIIANVAKHFRDQSIEVIDVTTSLHGRELSELIVSPADLHPSARLHQEVAQMLYNAIEKAK